MPFGLDNVVVKELPLDSKVSDFTVTFSKKDAYRIFELVKQNSTFGDAVAKIARTGASVPVQGGELIVHSVKRNKHNLHS